MVEDIKNQRLVFDLPEDMIVFDVIDEILKNNGLVEGPKEYLEKKSRGEETKLIIIRDAALVLFQKKIPENKLVELLAKHLECTKEVAEKIVQDIKEKLVPCAQIIEVGSEEEIANEREEEKREKFKKANEELLNKIRVSTPELEPEEKPPVPYDKNPEITDVEENSKKMAENMTDKKEAIQADSATEEVKKARTVLSQEGKKGPDDYRESLE